MQEYPDMLIALTTGKTDRGTRATLAFSWGCAALAMGMKVTIFMTMEGTIWAARGAAAGVEVAGFEPLDSYYEQFLALGGEILVCAPCTEYYCAFDKNQIDRTLVDEANLSGLATVVGRIGSNTKVVTF